MNLFEKLNRLDDSLVESRRAVKKKKLTESVEDDKKKLFDAAASVKCKLDDNTIEYAMYDVDDFIENMLVFAGNMLQEEHPEMLFWKYGEDPDTNYNVGGYLEVYESNDKYPDAYYQISHDRLYDITDEVNGDYDDDIDEMLTESHSDYGEPEDWKELDSSETMDDERNWQPLTLWKNLKTNKYVIILGDFTPWEGYANIETDNEEDAYSEFNAYMEDPYYNNDYDDNIDEMLTENRNNPYFAPYGYRDAARVLNGKAPQYYWHLKEIEMDRGDGIKLARYALRKGLPVMVDKNSDPDYPEFAIKGEYHWNDYFYPYPTAHEEDLVAWDGKMFVEEQLTEDELTPWKKLVKTFPDDFGHQSTRPANKTPTQHKTMNDYARDPNTPTYNNKEVTTKPEMSAKAKLLKHFPDLDIRSSNDFEEDFAKGNTVEESLVEEASEIYYLELFSNDGKTFEQSFSTYQEAEEEGNFSLENNPMTKEYIIYDKNHKRVKHKR